MKSIVFILLVVAIAAAQAGQLTADQKTKLKNIRSQCRAAVGVSSSQEQDIRNKKFTQLSDKQNCYVKCMTDAVKFTDTKSNVNQAQIHKLLDPIIGQKKTSQVSAACDKLKGKNPCQRAAIIYKCYADRKAAYLI